MTRCILTLSLLLVPACGLEEIDAILAKYDTFGSTGATSSTTVADTGTSTSAGTTDGPDSTSTTSTSEPGSAAGTDTGAGSSTGTGEQTTATSETTSAPPVCGDGLVEGDEECDDANAIDGDGCFNNCTRSWLVFVTSEPYTTGDIKGLIGADYQCRHRASKLFLPNGDRYMAWISTSEVQPADRLYHARGPYRLVNGDQVAADWDALIAGPLDHPIMLTELGEVADDLVFTGTTPDGWRVPNSNHCDDWTDNDGFNFAWYGYTMATDKFWTLGVETGCSVHAALYCFEQP